MVAAVTGGGGVDFGNDESITAWVSARLGSQNNSGGNAASGTHCGATCIPSNARIP
jgi:hypothetical protein